MERSADWIDQARGDLAHARQDLETGFYEWACFSAQQASEKAGRAPYPGAYDAGGGSSLGSPEFVVHTHVYVDSNLAGFASIL